MKSNYDKFPTVKVPASGGRCVRGWDAVATRLGQAVAARQSARTILTIRCLAE